MRFQVGDSVALRHERFLPTMPTGVVVEVNEVMLTLTFEEDFGGGQGTYEERCFEYYEPDPTVARWRAEGFPLPPAEGLIANLKALVILLYPDEMTPTAKRLFDQTFEHHGY